MSNQNQENKPATDEEIRRWVANDLASSVSLLNMIRNDPEMMKSVTDIIIGRIRTDEENKKLQPELDLNAVK